MKKFIQSAAAAFVLVAPTMASADGELLNGGVTTVQKGNKTAVLKDTTIRQTLSDGTTVETSSDKNDGTTPNGGANGGGSNGNGGGGESSGGGGDSREGW